MNNKNSILNEFELYQIDEVITGEKTGLFADFFKTYLGNLKRPVRGLGDAEAKADLAWLGLGLNGHVGFHEPGLASNFASGCVKLSEKTCHTLELEAGTWGLTYGAARFMECQAILMLVRGSSKRDVLHALEKGDAGLPASALLPHKDFTVLSEGL